MNKKLLFFCFITSIFNLTFGQNHSLKIDSLFSDYSISEKPGAVIAVVKDGKTIFNKGYGSANLEYTIPLSEETPFHIASLTKQFTAYGILLLEEKGKLSLDDSITEFLPELGEVGKGITIRQLMSHTSGLRDQWHLLALAGWQLEDVITNSQVLELIYDQKELNFNPGDEYMYSNSGYTLLAEIIKSVSGKSYPDYMQETIFAPLGMNNTFIPKNYRAIVKNRAYSYQRRDDMYFKSTYQSDLYGATGIITTMEDMTKWMKNFQNIQLGTIETIEVFNKAQILNDGTTFGGALGQFISNHKGRKTYQHTGSDAGFRTYFVRFPEEDLSIAVFSNRSNSNTKGLALNVADLFLKPIDKNVEKDHKNIIHPSTTSLSISTNTLKTYEGTYWNPTSNTSKTIRLENDTLQYIINKNRKNPIVPINKNTFLMLNVGQPVRVSFVSKKNKDLMKININDDNDIASERYEEVFYSTKDLTKFKGLYYSEELTTFIEIRIKNNNLVASHNRQESIILSPVKADFFKSDIWFFKNIEFLRKKQNLVGFKVSSNRMKNVIFSKINR